MYDRSPNHRKIISLVFLILASALLAPCSGNAAESNPETLINEHPASSADGVWTFIDPPDFPAAYSPPREFSVATVDAAVLQAVLAAAPPELSSAPRGGGVRMSLPLPNETFGTFNILSTQMMERALAAQFPDLQTFRFDSLDVSPAVSGHLTTGMSTLYATGASASGLLRIDPVESRAGLVFVVYYDRFRTDGLNEFEHVLDEQSDSTIPPPRIALQSQEVLPALDFEQSMFTRVQALPLAQTGGTLRTFRFLASTTNQFYVNNGNSDIAVLLSLLQRINAVNAVMEPELSVRLILAAATLNVLFDDPNTDPTNDGDTPCNLRDSNPGIVSGAGVAEGDYDVGFLFSTGTSGGCAWYVVCEDSGGGFPAHDKARGAGHFGATGTGLGTGLILHETGHQLGAKHTYSGQANGCNAANFDGDDGTLPSAFAPGSGTTIMSYFASCGTDNVDTSTNGNGQYYHAKSFEQIVDNITSGNGFLCGGSLNTGNNAPTVNAGPDYTIPRQTPFRLGGSGSDDEPLTFTWEQIDLATTRRPIDTDDGIGPIIRSVIPDSSPERIIPDIRDLLDNSNQPRNGVQKAGELVPQMDRSVNFRLSARDGLAGGGGVNSDDMLLTVSGAPFFVTSPNSGSLPAGCPVSITWEPGGGNAANVDIHSSTTGGLSGIDESFPDEVVLGTPNDGEYQMTVPCINANNYRIRVQASDNIYFDVNDNNLSVSNQLPVATVDPLTDGEVDDQCQYTVVFSGQVTDSCGVSAADVEVIFDKKPPGDFMLGPPNVNIVQNGPTQVDVSGSILMFDLMSSPATMSVGIKGKDNCDGTNIDFQEVNAVDNTPPEIDVSVAPDSLWPPNHKMVPIQATVIASDNCPNVSWELKSITSDEPDNGPADGDTVNDIQNADIGQQDLEFDLRSERAGSGDGRTYTIIYSAQDNGNNVVEDSATVVVPKNQAP